MLKPNMSHKTKPNKDVFRSAEQYRDSQIMESVNATRRLWDEYHSANYTSLGDWGRQTGVTYQAILKRFKNCIPIFNALRKHGVPFKSDKSLIGIYE